MKRVLLILFFLVLTVGLRAQRPEKYVVVLSMDGFRWDLASKAHTPTLDSLKTVGSYAEIYPCFPANTFPNHYSMATGLHPDHHGIVNNTFYDKRLGKWYSMGSQESIKDTAFWHGEPVWNTVERQGLVANVFMWVGSETPVNGRQASVWTPYDGSVSYWQRADWVLEALNRPMDSIPNLIMWYFDEPDLSEHRYAPDSPQTVAAVEHIDSVLCYFLREVRKSPVYDKINFIFTADHGMATLAPERYINLRTVLDSTEIVQAVPGTPLQLEPRAGHEKSVYQNLKKLNHLTVFRREEIPAKYHYGSDTNRIMKLVVLPETGWIVDYRVGDSPKKGGGHGFDPFDRDMHMVFYAAGPAFRKNYVQKPFQNLNIYLLICHLLDVEPAPNDGDMKAIRKMLLE